MGTTDDEGIFRPDRDDRDPYDEDVLREQDWNLRDPHAEDDVEPDEEG